MINKTDMLADIERVLVPEADIHARIKEVGAQIAADYRGKCPTRPHGMWQYTSKGRVAGIDGPVDLSDAAKDYPAICKRTGLGTFQAG